MRVDACMLMLLVAILFFLKFCWHIFLAAFYLAVEAINFTIIYGYPLVWNKIKRVAKEIKDEPKVKG